MLGSLESFDAHFDVSNFALLSGGTATVVATDAKGSPLLTVNAVGQGRAVYIAATARARHRAGRPWATPAPVAALLREVYGAVARSAGCGAPVECSIARGRGRAAPGRGRGHPAPHQPRSREGRAYADNRPPHRVDRRRARRRSGRRGRVDVRRHRRGQRRARAAALLRMRGGAAMTDELEPIRLTQLSSKAG